MVKVEIAEARSEVMAPLSAASMESYTRAYPYLVKLHMLQASHSLLRLITYLAQILPLAKHNGIHERNAKIEEITLACPCTHWSQLAPTTFGYDDHVRHFSLSVSTLCDTTEQAQQCGGQHLVLWSAAALPRELLPWR